MPAGSVAAIPFPLVGIGCVLVLWTLLAGIAAVAAATGAYVFVSGMRSGSTVRIVIGGLLAAGGSVVVLGAIAFVASWLVIGGRPHHSTSPDEFRAQFGFAPGQDVSAIESESSGSTDSNRRFLRFRSSPRTIAAITTGRFEAAPFSQCEQQFLREKKPHWWSPRKAPGATCYKAVPFDDSFASNEAWLTYDSGSGQAHFYYFGVD